MDPQTVMLDIQLAGTVIRGVEVAYIDLKAFFSSQGKDLDQLVANQQTLAGDIAEEEKVVDPNAS